jgi:uncharacterized membrane protein
MREGGLALSEEQRTRIEAHHSRTLRDLAKDYDVDISDSQKQISLGMRIVSALGGLAFCAAVFFFFYRFWGLVSTPLQVALLATTPLLGLVAMEAIARRERTLYYTSLLGLVVLASFALNMAELGNIFNMEPTPNAFLAWAILALALAYSYRLWLALAAGLVSASIYFAAILMTVSGAYWGGDQCPENYLVAGLLILAVPLTLRHSRCVEFPAVYRAIGWLLVFLALLLLGNAGELSWLPLAKKTVQGLYQIAGFVAAGTAIWVGIRHRFSGTANLGSAFFAVYLFNRMFSWWWGWLPRYLFFFVLGVMAVLLLAVFRKIRLRVGV